MKLSDFPAAVRLVEEHKSLKRAVEGDLYVKVQATLFGRDAKLPASVEQAAQMAVSEALQAEVCRLERELTALGVDTAGEG